MAFARFMSSPVGRGLRIVAGIAIAAAGLGLAAAAAPAGPAFLWIVVAAVGGLVFVAGVLNVCFIAPIIRAPFRGKDAHL